MAEQDKRLKKEYGQSAKLIQLKDREIVKLKGQLLTASASVSSKKSSAGGGIDEKIKKEFE